MMLLRRRGAWMGGMGVEGFVLLVFLFLSGLEGLCERPSSCIPVSKYIRHQARAKARIMRWVRTVDQQRQRPAHC